MSNQQRTFPPPLEQFNPHHRQDDDVDQFFATAAHPDQVYEADVKHRDAILFKQKPLFDARLIYLATLFVIVGVVVSRNNVFTPSHICLSIVPVAYKVFVEPISLLMKNMCSDVQIKDFPWVLLTDIEGNSTPFGPVIPVTNEHLADEMFFKAEQWLKKVHTLYRGTSRKVSCLYEFTHTLGYQPSLCVMDHGRWTIAWDDSDTEAVYNMELRGYGGDKVTIPERLLICGGQTQSKQRRKVLDILFSFRTAHNTLLPMRSLIDDEQQAFDIQMHLDVMNDKYTCREEEVKQ